MKKQNFPGLRITTFPELQFQILVYIHNNGPCAVAQIIDCFGDSYGNVWGNISSLKKRGYISTTLNEYGKQALSVKASDKGNAAVKYWVERHGELFAFLVSWRDNGSDVKVKENERTGAGVKCHRNA